MSTGLNEKTDDAKANETVLGLSHLSFHVRDIDEAIRFWTTIFDAAPYSFSQQPESGRAHLANEEKPTCVRLGGTVLHFSRAEGISGWDKEYPHFAFEVSSEQLVTQKRRLDEAGVKTHPIWTRNKVEGLMYFRDPSGNLFEFYCWQFDGADSAEVDAHKGGGFRPPISDLAYDWKG